MVGTNGESASVGKVWVDRWVMVEVWYREGRGWKYGCRDGRRWTCGAENGWGGSVMQRRIRVDVCVCKEGRGWTYVCRKGR